MRRYELSDFEWSVIQPNLPCKVRGVARVDDCRVLNGILWRFRTGSPGLMCRSATAPTPPATTGLFDGAKPGSGIGFGGGFHGFRRRHRHDRQFLCSRSPARDHGKKRGSDDGCMGRSRGGLTTKIHALVDAEGRPIDLVLTAG